MPILSQKSAKIALGTQGPHLFVRDLGFYKYCVSLDELDTHIYVVGKSGKGKSKFLEGLLWQFITMGQGCGVIDPHGDLANNVLKLLATIPLGPQRTAWLDDQGNAEKVVYCEPGRSDYFIPMNVLQRTAHRPYQIATDVIEAFQRTWSETLSAAPQFKNVALHSLLLPIDTDMPLPSFPNS